MLSKNISFRYFVLFAIIIGTFSRCGCSNIFGNFAPFNISTYQVYSEGNWTLFDVKKPDKYEQFGLYLVDLNQINTQQIDEGSIVTYDIWNDANFNEAVYLKRNINYDESKKQNKEQDYDSPVIVITHPEVILARYNMDSGQQSEQTIIYQGTTINSVSSVQINNSCHCIILQLTANTIPNATYLLATQNNQNASFTFTALPQNFVPQFISRDGEQLIDWKYDEATGKLNLTAYNIDTQTTNVLFSKATSKPTNLEQLANQKFLLVADNIPNAIIDYSNQSIQAIQNIADDKPNLSITNTEFDSQYNFMVYEKSDKIFYVDLIAGEGALLSTINLNQDSIYSTGVFDNGNVAWVITQGSNEGSVTINIYDDLLTLTPQLQLTLEKTDWLEQPAQNVLAVDRSNQQLLYPLRFVKKMNGDAPDYDYNIMSLDVISGQETKLATFNKQINSIKLSGNHLVFNTHDEALFSTGEVLQLLDISNLQLANISPK